MTIGELRKRDDNVTHHYSINIDDVNNDKGYKDFETTTKTSDTTTVLRKTKETSMMKTK